MSEIENQETIELLNKEVEYESTVSNNATQPRIDVDIRGIRVVLPNDSNVDPDELLKDNARWVLKKKEKYDEYRRQAPDRTFEEGELFPYLGKPRELKTAETQGWNVTDTEIHIPKKTADTQGLKEALRDFYRDKARELFTEKTNKYAEQMGVEYENISVRNQRTRWGSCSPKKNLSYNWRLLMAPEDIIDYVVVHELAHLKEKNHTNKFWRIVRQYIPEYKDKASWLENNSSKLIFSKQDL